MKHPAQNYLEWAVSHKRGHGSETEAAFVADLLAKLYNHENTASVLIDGVGNLHAIVGASTILFTAHTDTVHNGGGPNAWSIDNGTMITDGTDALGADDGCGIALMLHMIDNGIPGRYVFFRGEECGGIGSKGIVRAAPELFKGITHAIAFDRAGLGDVITHQSGGRCCSDEFAQALADQLNTQGMMYSPDSSGIYTDTAEFTRLIPECTNLSVGYFSQHGLNETVNMAHFLALADQALRVDWSTLPVVRRLPKQERNYTGSSLSKLAIQSIYDEGYDFEAYNQLSEEAAEELDTLSHALEQAAAYQKFALLAEILAVHSFPDEPEQHDAATQYYERHLARIPEEVLLEYLGDLEITGDTASVLDMISSDIINTSS